MKSYRHDLKDLTDLALLARSTYSKGEIISENYLEWEYTKNPAGNAIAFVEKDVEKIAGQYILIPKDIVVDGTSVKSSLSLNTITHPDFRGKGVFPRLAELTYSECKIDNIDFTVGFPNANSVKVFLGKLKFVEIGRMPLLLNVVNPLKAIANFIKRRGSDSNEELVLKIDSTGNDFSSLDLIIDADRYDQFLTTFESRGFITSKRSREYLKWRYVDIPLRKYHLFKYENNGIIESIVVIRAKEIMGVRCGIIVDYFSLGNSVRSLSIIKELKKNELDLIIATLPEESSEYKSLLRSGFFKIPEFLMFKKLYVILRYHRSDISKTYSDFKKWFITFGDYDIF